jgi:3-oxoacyl-[acyl-carrier protein] reductase
MVGLSRSWARELGPDNITVNVVEPGWIPMERDDGDPDLPSYLAGIPLAGPGRPADVGATVTWLASPEAGFITGQRIAVNGGNTMQ